MATPSIKIKGTTTQLVVTHPAGGTTTITFEDSALDKTITIAESPYVVTSLEDLVFALDAMGLITDGL